MIEIRLKKDEEEGPRVHDADGGVGQGKQRRRRKVREPGGRGRGTKDLQMKERRDD